MSLPRYPEYKPSGVEWLGEVPGHWDVAPLKRSFKIVGGSTPKSEQEAYWDGEYIWVTPSDLSKFSSMGINDSQRKITDEGLASCGTTLVPSGSIVLSTRAPIGSLAIAATELCTNQGCKSLVPFADTQSQFYGYLLSVSTGELNIRGKGTTFLELSGDELGAFKVGVPPRAEQQTIAVFLDRETGKIDALIAEQRRLVELLAEKRQAVISHAVIKGLPSTDSGLNAPMKDSGIEWLGEVPEHWEVKRLRFVAELNPSKSEVATLDKDMLVSFLPMDAIGDDGKLNLEREKPIAEVETGYTFFRDGDVTVAKITPCFENGKGAVMRGLTQGIGFGTTELIVARPITSQADSEYLHYLFTSAVFRKNGEGFMYGAGGQKRVPDDFVRNFEIAFPLLKEQQIIAAFLDTETTKFDTLTAEANRAIALLQEHRSSLISAAVTGKIDVREAVIPAQAGIQPDYVSA